MHTFEVSVQYIGFLHLTECMVRIQKHTWRDSNPQSPPPEGDTLSTRPQALLGNLCMISLNVLFKRQHFFCGLVRPWNVVYDGTWLLRLHLVPRLSCSHWYSEQSIKSARMHLNHWLRLVYDVSETNFLSPRETACFLKGVWDHFSFVFNFP